LVDAYGRHLEYLRLSVTERCNFHCAYCLPHGCPLDAGAAPLDLPEIERLVRAFADLGFSKVRLTGGEPTLRADIVEIVKRVSGVPGLRHVGMTTNGFRLAAIAGDLARAGLTCLNVSVDSLDPERFAAITGSPALDQVVAGVEAALAAGIPRVKVNAVLLAGTLEADLDRFLAWVRERPLTVRFIELMETARDPAFFAREHVPAAALERQLQERGWRRRPRAGGDGPSADHVREGHRGRIGVIAPYRKDFCKECNRLRVTAAGRLRLCLFDAREVPLRHLLGSGRQRAALAATIRAAVGAKPEGHHLAERRVGDVRSLASIGG
jgi:cyclic pyranopterin phosphate synthase